ncbi:MAG: hypothetical protein ABW026_11060 [Microvirga sp.]
MTLDRSTSDATAASGLPALPDLDAVEVVEVVAVRGHGDRPKMLAADQPVHFLALMARVKGRVKMTLLAAVAVAA